MPFRLNAVTIVDDGISAIIIANNIKMAAGAATILTSGSTVDDRAMVVCKYDSDSLIFVEGEAGLRQNGSLLQRVVEVGWGGRSVTFKSADEVCCH